MTKTRCLPLPQRAVAELSDHQPRRLSAGSLRPKTMRRMSAAQPLYQQRDQTKVMTRHVWESSKEAIDRHRLERVGKRDEKRPWNAASPTPNNCTATAMPGCATAKGSTAMPAGCHRAEHQENSPAH